MMYQHSDGTYTISTPDGESSRRVSKEEGEQILRDCGCPEEIINDKRIGFAMT
jgi:hypothetical protein